jgi:hypothetical protein
MQKIGALIGPDAFMHSLDTLHTYVIPAAALPLHPGDDDLVGEARTEPVHVLQLHAVHCRVLLT